MTADVVGPVSSTRYRNCGRETSPSDWAQVGITQRTVAEQPTWLRRLLVRKAVYTDCMWKTGGSLDC